MVTFMIALLILLAGYQLYGRAVEKIVSLTLADWFRLDRYTITE